jgi:4-amino-4-deoxy-L-arabinose transferase-like glycosyltransferase
MPTETNQLTRRLLSSFWVIAAFLTAIRIFALLASPAALGPDESQYWFWSITPAFGYFSKPPFIAWAIAATTSVFGNAEWAVRLSAPLFHLGAASFLYLTAKKLFDQHIAYWTGLAWLTIPGVTLSSFLITTDAPLLFFWSAALFLMFRTVQSEKPKLLDFAALGGAIGLGLLSKYAMIYFAVALGGAIIVIPSFRHTFLRRELFLTVAVTVAIIAPNIWWNAANDFQTVSHTAANANWGASLFKPATLLTFVVEQFAVVGPIFFAALIWAAVQHGQSRIFSGPQHSTMRALFLFALTPLIIVSIQAFISRAHANWAAAAYPAVILLVIPWLFERRAGWVAKASIAVHIALAVVFIFVVTQFSIIDRFGLSGAIKEIRGWKEQSHAIASRADGFDAVMLDDRALMGAMLYYERGSGLEIVAIDPNASISHHYEAFMAFDPRKQSRVLFATTRDDAAHVDYRFRKIIPLGPTTVELGSGQQRTYHLFDISGYYGPGAPQGETGQP